MRTRSPATARSGSSVEWSRSTTRRWFVTSVSVNPGATPDTRSRSRVTERRLVRGIMEAMAAECPWYTTPVPEGSPHSSSPVREPAPTHPATSTSSGDSSRCSTGSSGDRLVFAPADVGIDDFNVFQHRRPTRPAARHLQRRGDPPGGDRDPVAGNREPRPRPQAPPPPGGRVLEVWLIDPAAKTVEVHTADGVRTALRLDAARDPAPSPASRSSTSSSRSAHAGRQTEPGGPWGPPILDRWRGRSSGDALGIVLAAAPRACRASLPPSSGGRRACGAWPRCPSCSTALRPLSVPGASPRCSDDLARVPC